MDDVELEVVEIGFDDLVMPTEEPRVIAEEVADVNDDDIEVVDVPLADVPLQVIYDTKYLVE